MPALDGQARVAGRHICSRCSLCCSSSLEIGAVGAAAGRVVVVVAVVVVVGSLASVPASPPEEVRQNGIGAHTY